VNLKTIKPLAFYHAKQTLLAASGIRYKILVKQKEKERGLFPSSKKQDCHNQYD
jgi:hypothetical protein